MPGFISKNMRSCYLVMVWLLTAVAVVFGFAFMLPTATPAVDSVIEGKLDLVNGSYQRQSANDEMKNLPLAGSWEYYEGALYTPEQLKDITPKYARMPDINNKKTYEYPGIGTYRMVIALPSGRGYYGLKIPPLSTASVIYINGVAMVEVGSIWNNGIEGRNGMKPAVVYFDSHEDNYVEIVINARNYSHYSSIMTTPIIFGTMKNISLASNLDVAADSAVVILFLYLMASFIVFAINRDGDRRMFYLAGICFSLLLRTCAVNFGLVYSALGENFYGFMMSLNPVTMIMCTCFSVLFYFESLDCPPKGVVMYRDLVVAMSIALALVSFAAPDVLKRGLVFASVLFSINACVMILLQFALGITDEAAAHKWYGLFLIAGILLELCNEYIIVSDSSLVCIAGLVMCAVTGMSVFAYSGRIQLELKTLNLHLNEIVAGKTRALMIANDELKKLNYKLEIKSVTDPLTKAYNRSMFQTELERRISKFREDNEPLSVIMLDIDWFKKINDTYGHEAGDSVLVEMVEVIKQNILGGDILARWGGEEFVILLPGTNLEKAAITAEKLRIKIENHRFTVGQKVTASFGVAAYNEDVGRGFISDADRRLYIAKQTGRNRTCWKG